jgi:multidrug efflux pump
LRLGNAPLAITHQGLFPSVTISFDKRPGASLEEALQTVRRAELAIGLPLSVIGSFAGDAAEFQASLITQSWLILAAIIAVYIVLGVLYESIVHPITILSTLPSAGIGALIALMVTGNELSLIGVIAIVLLIGIVKKNAIMMIDFALDAQREGMPAARAIFEASVKRFRPIMMTTMAGLLGAIPLALGTGAGSELRRPLGVAIVGGLLLSQFLTLFTTPVIYLALERFQERISLRHARRTAAPAE